MVRAIGSKLSRLLAELGGQDFVVLAVSWDKQVEAVRRFFALKGISNLGIFMDPNQTLGTALGVVQLPTTILIDRSGLKREFSSMRGPGTFRKQKAHQLLSIDLGD